VKNHNCFESISIFSIEVDLVIKKPNVDIILSNPINWVKWK